MEGNLENRDGVQLFFNGNYSSSKNKFEIAVGKGNSKAMVNLALLFYFGYLGYYDKERANILYKIAAELGDSFAQFHLAVCYLFGLLGEKDVAEGNRWMKKSCEAGNAEAFMFCANMTRTQGKEKSYVYYLNLALTKGKPEAWEQLEYQRDFGIVPEDYYSSMVAKYQPYYTNYYSWINDYIPYAYQMEFPDFLIFKFDD